MSIVDSLKVKYPGASAWPFGDNPEMADKLSGLVLKGIKTACCSSLSSFQCEDPVPVIGSYSIILNGQGEPVCVIRSVALRIIRFCDVTEDFAKKEGEGDLSLNYWKQGHQAFFQREGYFSETMELVVEEFELIEVL